MAKSEKELQARDAKRDIGAELLTSVRQMKAGEKGAVHKVTLSRVVEARLRAGLSQAQFARNPRSFGADAARLGARPA